jgi:alpha-1,2-glucosyltransferase
MVLHLLFWHCFSFINTRKVYIYSETLNISILNVFIRHEHPFILSDNRHYSFYVWHKIYRRHWTVRYLLTPAYTFSGFLNIQAFGRCYFDKPRLNAKLISINIAEHTRFLLAFGYFIALVLTLVPSPLFEFRYFIIPFLFYMVHIPPPTQTTRTIAALGLYLSIHLVTVYLFVYKPFVWTNEPDQLQRFMW